MQSFFESVGGRKFALVVLAMIATVIIGLAKDMEAAKLLDAIIYLTGIGAGSIALEEGLKGIGANKTPPATPPTV
jgi:hypothetical protein